MREVEPDFRVDHAAEGRAKAEAFGPRMRIIPTARRLYRTVFGPFVGIASKDVDPAEHPEMHAAIVQREAEEASRLMYGAFADAIDDAMLNLEQLDFSNFDFEAFTESLERHGYAIVKKENTDG